MYFPNLYARTIFFLPKYNTTFIQAQRLSEEPDLQDSFEEDWGIAKSPWEDALSEDVGCCTEKSCFLDPIR